VRCWERQDGLNGALGNHITGRLEKSVSLFAAKKLEKINCMCFVGGKRGIRKEGIDRITLARGGGDKDRNMGKNAVVIEGSFTYLIKSLDQTLKERAEGGKFRGKGLSEA